MSEPTAGSLCSGYDGLALAHGVPLAWHAENDRHAATIHDTHWPGLPNLGDLTAIDWSDVQPVDLLTAGFPCQPVSQAGQRKALNDDRWLWPHIFDGVRHLRPRWVLLENVAGLLRPWDDNGSRSAAPVADVLADLASVGYVGSWRSVRASDVGAPHERWRVFILATLADPGGAGTGRDVGAVPQAARGARREEPDVRPPVDAAGTSHLDWWYATPERADYAAAVHRWNDLFRPVPPLHDPEGRLNPRFSEWMMGLPDGWVTDCDIPVTAQHKAIGNGVCVQQARLAWLLLTGQDTHTHTLVGRLLPTPTTSDAKGGSPSHGGTVADLSLSLSLSLSLGSYRPLGPRTAPDRDDTAPGDSTCGRSAPNSHRVDRKAHEQRRR